MHLRGDNILDRRGDEDAYAVLKEAIARALVNVHAWRACAVATWERGLAVALK